MNRRRSNALVFAALVLLLIAIVAVPAFASADRNVALEQHIGVRLPLDAEIVDDGGRVSALSRFFGRTPVVLVFGYYTCPTLCTTMMEGVLLALTRTGLPANAYELVALSINPNDTVADAAHKFAIYRAAYQDVSMHGLIARSDAMSRLAKAAGLAFAYDDRYAQYAHPLALIVVNADGRISRYFSGVRFDPNEIRLALVEASQGAIGTLSDQIFLRCAHFDPLTGRYTVAVMNGVRVTAFALAALIALWIWRHRRAA